MSLIRLATLNKWCTHYTLRDEIGSVFAKSRQLAVVDPSGGRKCHKECTVEHVSGPYAPEVKVIDWLYDAVTEFVSDGKGKAIEHDAKAAILSLHRDPVNINFMGLNTVEHTDEALRTPHAGGQAIVVVSIQKQGLWLFESMLEDHPSVKVPGVVSLTPGSCIVMSGDVRYKFVHAVFAPEGDMIADISQALDKARVSLTLRFGIPNKEQCKEQKDLCAELTDDEKQHKLICNRVHAEVWDAIGCGDGGLDHEIMPWQPIGKNAKLQPSKKMITCLNLMRSLKYGHIKVNESEVLANGTIGGRQRIIADIVNKTIFFSKTNKPLPNGARHRKWKDWQAKISSMERHAPFDEEFYGRELTPNKLLQLLDKHVDPIKVPSGDVAIQKDAFRAFKPIASAYAKILNETTDSAAYVFILPIDVGIALLNPDWYLKSVDEQIAFIEQSCNMQVLPPVLIVPTFHNGHLVLLRCAQTHEGSPSGGTLEFCMANACGRDYRVGAHRHEIFEPMCATLVGIMRLTAERRNKCFVYHESQVTGQDALRFDNDWKGCGCGDDVPPLNRTSMKIIECAVKRVPTTQLNNYAVLITTATQATIFATVVSPIVDLLFPNSDSGWYAHLQCVTDKVKSMVTAQQLYESSVQCVADLGNSTMAARQLNEFDEWWMSTLLDTVRCIALAGMARSLLGVAPVREPGYRGRPLHKLRNHLTSNLRVPADTISRHIKCLQAAYKAIDTATPPSDVRFRNYTTAEHVVQIVNFNGRFAPGTIAAVESSKHELFAQYKDILMSADTYMQVYQYSRATFDAPGKQKYMLQLNSNVIQEYDSAQITWFMGAVTDAAIANATHFGPIQLLERVFAIQESIATATVHRFLMANQAVQQTFHAHRNSQEAGQSSHRIYLLLPDEVVLLPMVKHRYIYIATCINTHV